VTVNVTGDMTRIDLFGLRIHVYANVTVLHQRVKIGPNRTGLGNGLEWVSNESMEVRVRLVSASVGGGWSIVLNLYRRGSREEPRAFWDMGVGDLSLYIRVEQKSISRNRFSVFDVKALKGCLKCICDNRLSL
jgi:hypothetical protein